MGNFRFRAEAGDFIGRCWAIVALCLAVLLTDGRARAGNDDANDLFERRIRPLLIENCHRCHGAEKARGKLRLDKSESALRGGESGPAIVPLKPEESLLIQAVRQTGKLKMPPDGKLTETQIADLVHWVELGASWPAEVATANTTADAIPAASAITPDDPRLLTNLQLWLRASDLTLEEGAAVAVWPDQSPWGRDLSATLGIRPDGLGRPGVLVRESTVQRRAAVRFTPETGLASSPRNPLPIRGDAEWTMVLVMNLRANDAQPPFDGILGVGNPAAPADPGRALAALVQINRNEDHALHLAGGWNHDASAGAGSFKPWYEQSLILCVTKTAGPQRATTRLFVNGRPLGSAEAGGLEGDEAIPDIQHRADIGVYMGHATSWAGSFRGDVSEVMIFDRALESAERAALESYLSEKFAITLQSQIDASRATFSPAESSYWAFQPVAAVSAPAVQNEAWVRTPVDRFILSALEAKGMQPAAAADRRALLRRLTLDLTGLIPRPEELDAFVNDTSPNALETVVERLLESRAYGEHWGRHWLDVVRYAETTANDANAVMRYAWRYRNYVIEAFQRDLPYDQFIIEQLAGDLLDSGDKIDDRIRRTIATGFLMVGPKALAETDKEQSRLDIVDDQIDVTGRALLGLTLSCARCHDHKFDAIRTVDYYALAGIFRGTEPFQDEVRNASMWWEYALFQPPGEKPFIVMAPRDATPKNLRVHVRGNRFTLGQVVPRGFVQVLAHEAPQIAQGRSGRLELARWIANRENPLTARVMVNRIWQHHFGRGLVATSDNFGVRGERPSHPELLDYLALELMNRGWSIKAVQRLIVLSSAYQQQSRPSEQALAMDAENRWLSHFSLRRMAAEEVRDSLLVASGQLDASASTSEAADVLWKEAEILDDKRGFAPNRMQADHPFYTDFRGRSVYLPVVRNQAPDVLALFDGADSNNVTAVRNDTTVPSQSLFLLNSPLVRVQARHFAQRLLADTQATDEARIGQAHLIAFSRPATADEVLSARQFLASYLAAAAAAAPAKPDEERRLDAWQSYCQALLCSNEFLYVE